MNPQDPSQLSPQFDRHERVSDELTVLQPGETIICVIKRHPIGILSIYFGTGLLLITIAVLAFGIIPAVVGTGANSSTATQIGGATFIIFLFLCTAFALISTHIYWGNRWIVTSDSITQITQTGLFHRESSQLAMHSIEDVTAEKKGILATTFDFGVIRAETAGERSRFVFLYCPNPNLYARQILHAREIYDQKHRAQP